MRRLVDIRAAAVLAALIGLALPASAGAAFSSPTPSAAEFAQDFVDTANAYAKAHGRTARLEHPDCVSPKPGRYMCSYGIARPGKPLECHLVQASWTPTGPSTITITLAGRTARCENLRAAIRSLT